MKWYETKRPGGETFWWTQRDKAGNCFEIRFLRFKEKFRLYVDEMPVIRLFDSLPEAQAAVKEMEVL